VTVLDLLLLMCLTLRMHPLLLVLCQRLSPQKASAQRVYGGRFRGGRWRALSPAVQGACHGWFQPVGRVVKL
jgi:hypothetical protein